MKLSDLSAEQKRVMLAEKDGWRHGQWTRAYGGDSLLWSESGWTSQDGTRHPEAPNYLTDLNACHSLEERLTDAEYERFMLELWKLVAGDQPRQASAPIRFERAYLSATADQRSDALLLTLYPEVTL